MTEQPIPSDAPSEYMRGYSDGVEWAKNAAPAPAALTYGDLFNVLRGSCYVTSEQAHDLARTIRAVFGATGQEGKA